MVEMEMTDQDEIDRFDLAAGDRGDLPVERTDPLADRRIGQDPDPVELDPDGRMTEPVDRLVHRASMPEAVPCGDR